MQVVPRHLLDQEYVDVLPLDWMSQIQDWIPGTSYEEVSDAIFDYDNSKCFLFTEAAFNSAECSFEQIMNNIVITTLLQLDKEPKFCMSKYDQKNDPLKIIKTASLVYWFFRGWHDPKSVGIEPCRGKPCLHKRHTKAKECTVVDPSPGFAVGKHSIFSTFECSCLKGYLWNSKHQKCLPEDICLYSQPCSYQGSISCKNKAPNEADVNCQCTSNSVGKYCYNQVNPCLTNSNNNDKHFQTTTPCGTREYGDCVFQNLPGKYKCQCDPGFGPDPNFMLPNCKLRSSSCEDKFCHGRGVCAPKPKDPRNPHICRCEKGYYGNYCEDEHKETVFDLGGAKSKIVKKKESKRKKKAKKVFATIGIVLLVILAVVALIVFNVVTKGECLSVFFQFFGSCLTVFEVCFQMVAECCRQKTVSKEIQHTKMQAEIEAKDQETAALLNNDNSSAEQQDEEEQEGSEPKEEDGFFSRNLKRFLGYQTASQQATGLGYRIHKKVNEGADDDVIDDPLLGSSTPSAPAANGGEGPNISVKGPKFKRGRSRKQPKKIKVRGGKR